MGKYCIKSTVLTYIKVPLSACRGKLRMFTCTQMQLHLVVSVICPSVWDMVETICMPI